MARGGGWALLWLALALPEAILTVFASSAWAQDSVPSCAPAVARVVSLQGDVGLRRGGGESWNPVRKLDTPLCAGDSLRTGNLSRVLLHLQPETLVRVDQNTTIALKQSGEEIEVEFFASELAQALPDTRSLGAGYFITRFPKKFKVKTPHVNAAVEGTEFMVELSRDATKLTVLEGKVSSQSTVTGDTQLVAAGESLASGASGAGAIAAVIKPQDAVQWVLRYPPISDGSGASRAEELLRSGSVDEALAVIDSELSADPTNSDALALRAVIQVAKNDKVGALESAKKATAANVANYRAWLAMSYAQQAGFDLEAALEAALKASHLQASSALANARVAELYLSLGDAGRAEEAARAAVTANPDESHAHSILGFVHLAEIDTRSAQTEFQAAIDRDSFSALPRLGMGLAIIRDGKLKAGREQIEIAVALDPSNSILRSYVGKAYYEENTAERDDLAGTQLAMAADLDPLDPTPHLYEAIRMQTGNRPVEALREIRQSVALNDNRAVYRSEFKLDDDLAVRSASQGRIYGDLGFERLAVLDGWRSVGSDPGDFSGHRLLADTYSSLPRHELARVNELFVSQLLQPRNLSPVPPQLGEANLFMLDSAGPSDIAFNEFNPLFISDGQAIQASATVGGNDTWGDDVAAVFMQDRWSLSLGQFHFETDGFRPNNDLEQDTYNAFAQFRKSESTSYLAELRASRRSQGDLGLLFDPDNLDPGLREDEAAESIRIGLHHLFGRQSMLIASLVFQNVDFDSSTAIPSVGLLFDLKVDIDNLVAEIQHVFTADRWRLVSGLRQSHREDKENETLTITDPFFEDVTTSRFEFDSTSAYAYGYFSPIETVELQVGATADDLEGRGFEEDQISPKLGLTWEPSRGMTIRLAAMRTIQSTTYSRQDIPPRLEPTQVSGFNQVFAGVEGQNEWRYGLGLDRQVTPEIFVGVEASKRDIEFPVIFIDVPDEPFTVRVKEYSGLAYAFWMPSERLAFSARYQYDEKENDDIAAGEEGVFMLRTHRAPFSATYFHHGGLSAEATLTYVDQSGEFLVFLPDDPFFETRSAADRFWVLDAAIRYRLPRRMGIVALEANNILDEEFNFQDVDPLNPTILPERYFSMRMTIAF